MAGVSPVSVARAEAGDKERWIRLWRLWQLHMSGNVADAVTERTWQRALDPRGDLLILLAYAVAGDAIGFATVSFSPFAWTGSDIAFLQDLFVMEENRGQAAGEALLDAAYRHADERGASQVYWMVDEKNEKLQRFYARKGIRTPYLRYMRAPWP